MNNSKNGISSLSMAMVLAIFGPISGCQPKSDLDFLPMAVGATWEYRMEISEAGRCRWLA